MGNVPFIDLPGAEFLVHRRAQVSTRAIAFHLAEAHGEVNAALRRLNDPRAATLAEVNQTIDAIVDRWRAS